ncbi:hypothetical protein BCF55_0200 [Hydrogenivirga caldilitoris]|uniref:Probable membrane transporter protein n=1 Tax=Hydrogenivirga caldilitoris TaxID=246264 RepID=A0A497XNV6_9AQUI|nr:sulfite exporter TauE/SafE family protein [Hydrogenivirga caldilitoris]RLJ69941.1 hypothetical protein BCF55_0200 [Hydrogenivirga caldilitoris]
MEDSLLILLASFLAGSINAVAGGGTLITFPTLVFLGFDPVSSNMTNTVALWAGSLTGAYGFRHRLRELGSLVLPFFVVSTLGAIVGAVLLIKTPSETFKELVPFLILFAVLLLYLNEFTGKTFKGIAVSSRFALFLQFITGIYGSYFGAGIGIMMLASLALSGINHIHTANALKNLLGFNINLIGSLFFAFSGKVVWSIVPVMVLGFGLGGYFGAYISQRVKASLVRAFILLWGLSVGLFLLLR